jgi:hypothetical protein
MLQQKVLDAIQKLDYPNCELTDDFFTKLYCDDVGNIMSMNGFKQMEEILDALPQRIRLVYLFVDLQNRINCDGFLSQFYNHSVGENKRLLEFFNTLGFTDLTSLIEKAQQVILTKLPWPRDENHTLMEDLDSDVDIYDYLGEEITNQIDEIETEVESVLWGDELWKRVKAIWNSMQK